MILNELIVNSKITTYVDINKTLIAKRFSSSNRLSSQNGQINIAKVNVNPDSSYTLTNSAKEVLKVMNKKDVLSLRGFSTNMYLDNRLNIEVSTVFNDSGLISLSLWESNSPLVLEDYMSRIGIVDVDNYFVAFDFQALTIEIVKATEVEILNIKNLTRYHNNLSFNEDESLDIAVYMYLFDGVRINNIQNTLAKENPSIASVRDYLLSLDIVGSEEANLGLYYQIPINYVIAKYETEENHPNLKRILERLQNLDLKEKTYINVNSVGKNLIYYGVPGCGKSHTIRENYILREANHLVVTFHPEYSYYDFVGNISPVLRAGSLAYEFVAGPFTRILAKALADPRNHYYLIIEEINRANASSVFGDLFQLLDRNDEGESEYAIFHKEIAKYCFGDENKKIYLPKNLSLIGTMNTSDQNVFTLDTAFKRRFDFKYVKITKEEFKRNDFTIFHAKFLDEQKDITWGKFATCFNDYLMTRIAEELYASEDKQLGPWFLKNNGNYDATVFVEKVLRYIWDDVVKHEKSLVFNQKKFDEVLESFESDPVSLEKVFNPEFCRLLWS